MYVIVSLTIIVEAMFSALSQCQLLHPDPEEDSEDEEQGQAMLILCCLLFIVIASISVHIVCVCVLACVCMVKYTYEVYDTNIALTLFDERKRVKDSKRQP